MSKPQLPNKAASNSLHAPEGSGVVGHAEPAFSLLTDDDLYWFNGGNHSKIYDKLGAKIVRRSGQDGVYFAVWAPNAHFVSVVGDFNGWQPGDHPLKRKGDSGIWEGYFPGIQKGACYKYHIESQFHAYREDKMDPYGFHHEVAPKTASVVWDLDYEWGDQKWMETRGEGVKLNRPMSVYEVHLGSWIRSPDNGDEFLSYRDVATKLADYVEELGFTHVEFLPVMEHPFYGSWGYQCTGFFAPTSRFGTPQDFMYMIDVLHQRGIGVILDWVPSHFPTDGHALSYFDGTHLYEHADVRQGFHPDWSSYIFNYGRHEVRSFLISSAIFWLEKYHIDGLRVDAVASMLYLDYSRKDGEWIPNEFGGRENLEAIAFMRQLNHEVYRQFPDVQTIAEESTAWPMVSKPTYLGGLGFGMKWDMGWMHDTLSYMSREAVFRKFHHDQLTFRGLYMYNENFVLPLSHDEVVHGKGSLLGKMPGDPWQQFANLRLLFANQYAQPGKKLIFMGCEFGQGREWNHDSSLDWHQLDIDFHRGVKDWVRDLNHYYKATPALSAGDADWRGFSWLDCNDSLHSVLSWLRTDPESGKHVLVVFNFTPVPRYNYCLGAPVGGFWKEALNSDASIYRGAGLGNLGGVEAEKTQCHGKPFRINVTLPPLSALFFESE